MTQQIMFGIILLLVIIIVIIITATWAVHTINSHFDKRLDKFFDEQETRDTAKLSLLRDSYDNIERIRDSLFEASKK